MSIYRKMMIGFGIIILVMMIGNAYMLVELNAVSEAAKTTLSSDVHAIDLAKQLQSTLFEEERNGQKYLISRDNAYLALFLRDTAQFVQHLDSLFSMPLDHPRVRMLKHVATRHDSAVATIMGERDHRLLSELIAPLSSENRWLSTIDSIHGTLVDFIRLNQLSIDKAMHGVEATTHRSQNIALFLTIFTVLLAVAAAFVITRTMTRPIRILIDGVQQIGQGKFTPIRVTSRDEVALLAKAVNTMSAQLNRINELKEEMMQHIAHELRTPLATMLTAHYLLTEHSKGNLNPEQQRLLTVLRNGIDKLTMFSHDFLDLSKIEAGMMEYNFERTDISVFSRPLVDTATLTALPKNITIRFLTTPVPDVMIDREKFEQVVNNLLSNAIKYTDAGGSITVSVSPCDAGVRIAVQDTGVGIAPQDLQKVFTKFYRVRTASGTGTKGTGVGLALVKAVIEGHGGKVSAASTVGIGSTFTIELPAAPRAAADSGSVEAHYGEIATS